MQKIQRYISSMAVVTEVSHVFCCGIPMLFSLVGLLTSMGLVASMPGPLEYLHHIIHDYEIPMFISSACVIVLGWVLHLISTQIDCRSTGCVHEPCAPKKRRSANMLIIATLLFIGNLSAYMMLHQ